MQIKDLTNGMKKVNIEATVINKEPLRHVSGRYGGEDYTVADTVIEDETGSIKLVLWGEQIEQVNVNSKVKIENGYITMFKDQIQLNVGKYGKLTVGT